MATRKHYQILLKGENEPVEVTTVWSRESRDSVFIRPEGVQVYRHGGEYEDFYPMHRVLSVRAWDGK